MEQMLPEEMNELGPDEVITLNEERTSKLQTRRKDSWGELDLGLSSHETIEETEELVEDPSTKKKDKTRVTLTYRNRASSWDDVDILEKLDQEQVLDTTDDDDDDDSVNEKAFSFFYHAREDQENVVAGAGRILKQNSPNFSARAKDHHQLGPD